MKDLLPSYSLVTGTHRRNNRSTGFFLRMDHGVLPGRNSLMPLYTEKRAEDVDNPVEALDQPHSRQR